MNQLNVVIADNSAEFGNPCQKVLASYGMNVSVCEKDGIALLEKIRLHKPDVVLADMFMPNLDVLGVLSVVREMNEKERPMIMVFSSFDILSFKVKQSVQAQHTSSLNLLILTYSLRE